MDKETRDEQTDYIQTSPSAEYSGYLIDMTYEEYVDEVLYRWEQGELNELKEDHLIVLDEWDEESRTETFRHLTEEEFIHLQYSLK